ncbi:MAG TPA: hypothetical protein VHR38_00135 [Solirubrobacterales bacterium]|nr:hypothetical protein [Solirubrobacterales bacterium]
MGIELIQQGVEIALVDAPAMEEDQRALGLACRLAIQVGQLHGLTGPIGVVRRRHAGW